MSRPLILPTTGTAGVAALPSPPGDPEWLRGCAARLRRGERAARETPTLRGQLADVLPQVWAGSAADAAVHEAVELARRCGEALDHLGAAATALDRHAGELERAHDSVRRLQREWDRLTDQHARDGIVLRGRVVVDPGAATLLLRADQAHERDLVRLTQLHHRCLAELAAASHVTARAFADLDDVTLPRSAVADAASLRTRLATGLPFTAGAFGSAVTRERGASDAARLGGALATGDPQAMVTTIRSLRGDPADAVYAQAIVSNLGVGAVDALVLELAQTRSGSELDRARASVGVLGTLLLAATTMQPGGGTSGAAGGRDPGTERQVQSAAALLRDELVQSLGAVTTSGAAGTSATGAWLTGQLVVGARTTGWTRPLDPALVRRLAGGIASAELAETRDDDATRRMGTSLPAGGEARFASLFDDPDTTGDALHVVLGEAAAGQSDSDAVALLSEPVDGHGVTGSRGGPLVLGEALVRRWVTVEAGGTRSHPDLTLATNDDLARLLAAAGGAGTAGAAGTEATASLRARVMSEVARASSFAQQTSSTATIYRLNTAAVENSAVGWVLDMPEAVDAALLAPGADVGQQWSTQVGGRHEPLLTVDELTSLIAAFSVGAQLPRSAKTPDATYLRLVDGELARAASGSKAAGTAALRLGFFEQAASAALVDVARRQDTTNQSMWRALAEAKALALSWKEGPVAFGQAVVTLTTGGTNRTAEDDLAVAVVRSDVELEQTVADESRTQVVAATLEAMDVDRDGTVPSAAALCAAGARRGPALASSADLALARRRERADAVTAVVQGAPEQLGLQGGRRRDALRNPEIFGSDIPTAFASPANGDGRLADVGGLVPAAKPHAHELDTAQRLRNRGHVVEFLPRSDKARSPDALVDGEPWEFKAPIGSSRGTIVQALRSARAQSSKIVLELARSPLSPDEALR
jgi:hypothetical protein